jgi:predicted esterase
MPDLPIDYQQAHLEVVRPVRIGWIGAAPSARRSLWVALHGYGERADVMARRATWPAAPHRTWAFPEAPHRFYVTEGQAPGSHADLPVGASWMTRDLREVDIAANHAYLDHVVEHVGGAPRLIVFGFSQGAATAARWAAHRAAAGHPPAHLVCWGALLAHDLPLGAGTALAAVPLTLVCGTRDRWISDERFGAEVSRLAAAGHAARVLRFEGGHRVDDATLRTVAAVVDP